LLALPKEIVEQLFDGSHAQAGRRVDPGDERIETSLEILELLDVDCRKIRI